MLIWSDKKVSPMIFRTDSCQTYNRLYPYSYQILRLVVIQLRERMN